MSLTIEDLKAQRRWVLWRLINREGEKPTKIPYSRSSNKASSTDPTTWCTYAEAMEAFTDKAAGEHPFSGVGLVFGTVDGVQLSGVDIDLCCDPVNRKFTPESRAIVIELDSYSEFSPSGTGCHILVLGGLRGRKSIHEAFPGAKAVEIYDRDRYFTFTGRHLEKTPADIVFREDALNGLYDRVMAHKATTGHERGLLVSASLSEEERLEQLMHGDLVASLALYHDDHSAADFALCCLLAKKHDCNAFRIQAEFEKSKLYREKWTERDDYRENTITKAIKAVAKEIPIMFDHDGIGDDDSPTEYIVPAKPGELEGWFPKGELSLIGAASGRGKSSWAMPLLENVRQGKSVWSHPAGPGRDYRILLHDRSVKATRRTITAQHLGKETVERLLRLTREQQKRDPGETLAAYIEQCPGVETWYVEGLDMWFGDGNKMSLVADVLDNLVRVAVQFNVAVVATVGSPKMKGKDRYYGRDSLFGSAALGRKSETVVLMNLTDEKDNNSTRRCDVLKRNGPSETFYFSFSPERGLYEVEKPDEAAQSGDSLAFAKMSVNVAQAFAPDEPLKYRPSLGAEKTFYRWRDWAYERGKVSRNKKLYYLAPQTSGADISN